jgi:hypothetical protein
MIVPDRHAEPVGFSSEPGSPAGDVSLALKRRTGNLVANLMPTTEIPLRRPLLDQDDLDSNSLDPDRRAASAWLPDDPTGQKETRSRPADNLSGRRGTPFTLWHDPDAGEDEQLSEGTLRSEEATLVLGLSATVGYVLWNVRNFAWLTGLAFSSPMWKQFDLADVLSDEENQGKRPAPTGPEDEEDSVQRVLE